MSTPSAPLFVVFSCLVAALLAIPLPATSQDAPPPAYSAHPADRSPAYKSVATARGLSIGAMGATAMGGGLAISGNSPIAGGVLLASSLFVGPSAGIFYAGDSRRAWQGIAVRGGGAVGTGALTLLLGSAVGSGSESPGPLLNVLFFLPALTGLGLLAHGIYDAVFVSARAVDAHNEALNGTPAAVSVRPWVSPYEGQPGVQLRVGW